MNVNSKFNIHLCKKRTQKKKRKGKERKGKGYARTHHITCAELKLKRLWAKDDPWSGVEEKEGKEVEGGHWS